MATPFPFTLFSPAASPGFSPTSIAGLKLWFDASDGATITQSGGAVSQWNDKSGNGNNATQATGSQQPTVQTAAQNGKNTLRFTSASSQRMLTNSAVSVSKYTAIGVVRRGGPSGANIIEAIGDTTTGTNAYAMEWYSDQVIYAGISSKYFKSTAQSSTGYNVVVTQANAATSGNAIRLNGTDITSAQNLSGPSGASFNSIGFADGLYTNGEIAELCFYDSVLSLTNVQLVESYLKTKWGTP